MKNGFTLAEVLITLGIIGIVAAMTIPQVLANYRKKSLEAKLKETYSILLNAVNKGNLEVGIPFSTYSVMTNHPDKCPTNYEFAECAEALYDDYLKDSLSKSVVKPSIKILNSFLQQNGNSAPFELREGRKFLLPNGVLVNICQGAFFIVTETQTNWAKKKITIVPGKNTFVFGTPYAERESNLKFISAAMLPMFIDKRAQLSRNDLIEKCKFTSDVWDFSIVVACSQLFIEDGFVFKDDYPIKF